SRVTSGKIVLHKAPIDLCTLAQRCVQAVDARDVRVTCSIPPSPVTVDGDALRLEQVVVNLVTNAVKYTPAGGRVEVRVERGDRAILRVIDDGSGIAADMLPVVFDLFAQVEGTLDRA